MRSRKRPDLLASPAMFISPAKLIKLIICNEMTNKALKQFYYDSDYYQLKLEEVVKTDEEIFEETIYKLSRKELPSSTIQSGLSNFAKTIHGNGFAFLTLNLSNKEIYSVRGIEKFVHLQNIDISHNKITDLEPLNGLNVLIRINASHNLLSSLKHFK